MKVKEFMTRDVTSVSVDMKLRDVIRVLALHQLTGLPVVDDGNRVVGYISERDIIESAFPGRLGMGDLLVPNFMHLASQAGELGERKTKDLMHTDVIVVDEETEQEDAAEIFVSDRVRSLPVVRNGRLVGVLSRMDLLRVLMEDVEETA